MDQFQIYNDIQARTGGEIYIGVVGPVRTGKSTFIRRFMEIVGLPLLSEYERQEVKDQLPISGSGKMITTVEPKFIPKNSLKLNLSKDIDAKLRLIDCVGFVIPGSEGDTENGAERMIRTPWSEQEIPFKLGAEIGTKKVIEDHATFGILMTTDGTIGEFERENYIKAEEELVELLKCSGKPFVIILNSNKPYSQDTKVLVEQLKDKYKCYVMAFNCDQLRNEDITKILENILLEFPIVKIEYHIPKWTEMLPILHPIKQHLICVTQNITSSIKNLHDVNKGKFDIEDEYLKRIHLDNIDSSSGSVCVNMQLDDKYYYLTLSELANTQIGSEYDLIRILKELTDKKQEYLKVENAIEAVRSKGYGIVMPHRNEIELDEPELIKQGSKYGVLIRAISPSIHMIKANIETEIAPIVGNEEQAKDLISFIETAKVSEDGLWDTNIFGKTIEQLVEEGIQNKVNLINDASQQKLQDSMEKIVNDSKGGMVCIII